MPIINGMLVQSGGSRPHVVYIMETLAETFPNVIWKIGGEVDRTTRGGEFSFHSEGRACDIYLSAHDPLDKKLGDLLFNLFSTESVALKVHHTIWNGRISSDATGWRSSAYTGSGGPHEDHVHVAFKNDHLEAQPRIFTWLCQQLVGYYIFGNDGASDRQDGLHGQAFNPKRPNIRLTKQQRHKMLLKNMGFEGADQ